MNGLTDQSSIHLFTHGKVLACEDGETEEGDVGGAVSLTFWLAMRNPDLMSVLSGLRPTPYILFSSW